MINHNLRKLKLKKEIIERRCKFLQDRMPQNEGIKKHYDIAELHALKTALILFEKEIFEHQIEYSNIDLINAIDLKDILFPRHKRCKLYAWWSPILGITCFINKQSEELTGREPWITDILTEKFEEFCSDITIIEDLEYKTEKIIFAGDVYEDLQCLVLFEYIHGDIAEWSVKLVLNNLKPVYKLHKTIDITKNF